MMTFIVGMFLIITATVIGCVVAENVGKVIALVAGVVVGVGFFIANSIVYVPAGEAGVGVWFGNVSHLSIPPGLTFRNPMLSVVTFNTRRDTIDFANREAGTEHNPVNGPSVLALSQDRNPLTIAISFPYNLNEEFVWKLYERIGTSDKTVEAKLLETNARKVVAEVFARYPWADATLTERTKIEEELRSEFTKAVQSDLMNYGFSQQEAAKTLTVSTPQLREVKPDERVLGAIAERLATEEQLKRQRVLTDIAAQEAARRSNEGVGISNLFEKLPKGFKPDEIRMVLGALADKERADALAKAVELGKVNIIAVPSGSAIAIGQ